MSGGTAPILPVVYSDNALRELNEIANWNEDTYGRDHAKRYIAFLEKNINELGKNHPKGKILETRTDIRYILIRRKSKGHGHVAVYNVDNQTVGVLHIFHTAQDWQAKVTLE